MDQRFTLGVRRPRRFVQNENRRVAEDCPSQRNPLALSPGEPASLFTDSSFESVGHLVEESRDIRAAGSLFDFGSLCPRLAIQDVFVNRVVEQQCFLRDHADLTAEILQGDIANVDAVDGDCAEIRVVECGSKFTRVDLPDPFSPTTAITSPALTDRDTSASAAGRTTPVGPDCAYAK